ncbi:glyoxylate/hydroxypyruvate reductase A [Halomonas piscis]|uniref:Glyoxylate/hydroxypyruvate reductase A n=1 Tax=Halomonas piscis TaxID=3031727 RepID=A0ABY9YXI8_9GAMM|nr:glyoxylate/hydroxypyruvate reductase A [Halomonas piscis]WNK19605.1 glyoxylate/hydroxypyruvate reductase A [Halomonas piscis]
MKIVVHNDSARRWCAALEDAFPHAAVVTSDAPAEARQNADYLAVWKPPEWLLAEQTRLKGIVNLGAGVDALLATPGLPDNVPVVKLRDAGMASPMADYVLYGVLHFYRSFDAYVRLQSDARWAPRPVPDKADWPVGVLGLGAIGAHVAQTLSGAGFPVMGWSRTAKDIDGVDCHHGDAGLDAVLGRARTLVTLLPDTDDTRGLMDAGRLAQLPEGATLINPGRGALIDEAALLEALGDDATPGHLRGALLDVFATEPLPADNPLWQHPRVTVTPHTSAPTPLGGAIDQVIDYLRAFEAGEPVSTVNPAAGY